MNREKLEWILKVHRLVALDPHIESCGDIVGSSTSPSFTFRMNGKSKKVSVPKDASLDTADAFAHDVIAEKLKGFKEFKESNIIESDIPSFASFRIGDSNDLAYLNESENLQVNEAVKLFEEECDNKLANVDEGFLGKLVGGAAGFIVGPMIGRIIANALGIEKGIFYDMLTSRLVTTALGVAIAKYMGGDYKN